MSEEQTNSNWIERCAERIQLRHLVPAPDAVELATEMHTALGGRACPERVADELFGEHCQ